MHDVFNPSNFLAHKVSARRWFMRMWRIRVIFYLADNPER